MGSPLSVVWACILCGSMALLVLVVLLACSPLAFNGELIYLNHSFVTAASQVQGQTAQTYYNGIRMALSDLLKPLDLGVRSGHLGG